jgi:hypothetical protein
LSKIIINIFNLIQFRWATTCFMPELRKL